MGNRIDRGAEDPDGTAAEARAALKRNTEIGLAPPESPRERRPAVSPETFGEDEGFRDGGGREPGDVADRADE